MIELGVYTNRSDQILCCIEPQRLAAPDDAADAITIQLDALAVRFNRVLAAMFDSHVAVRQCFERALAAFARPVANHHLLHRDRRVAANGEEAVACRGFTRLRAFTNLRSVAD